MSDRQLASVLAAELNEYLRSLAAGIVGPVYAVSLWSYGEYGEFGVNIATERGYEPMRRANLDLGMSDEELTAPASVRWNSGDWEFGTAERFCTESTQRQLNVLRDVMDEAGFRYVDDPNEVNCAALAKLERQWDRLANDVMAQARPLSLLACGADAIAWVECANYTRPVEHAMSMTLTSDRDVLRRLFPHWRRLRDALDAIDPSTLGRLREFSETRPLVGIRKRYEQAAILTPEVEQLLADCGFTWWDLANWDGGRVPSDFDPDVPNAVTNHTIALAFVVADRIG